MGIVFDIVMLLYLALMVFIGYKRGFLLSVAGIAAMVLAVTIYKIFNFDYIYFAVIYILLIVVIAILSRVIRKLKVPIIAKLDILLGTILGAFNGLIGIAHTFIYKISLHILSNYFFSKCITPFIR